jgi:hypothetical protein
MTPLCSHQLPLATTRREFLQRSGMSLGALALGTLFTDEAWAASALAPRKPPLPCKAKHVIHIFAGGAPSHLDTFDYKPTLEKFRDQPAAALIADLKQKGLLDETLIIWGGEFGRPPNTAGRINDASGRDHWSKVYC